MRDSLRQDSGMLRILTPFRIIYVLAKVLKGEKHMAYDDT